MSENAVNLDLFKYINSKFVYIERHLRIQVNNLYINLVTEKCEIERKVIQNFLSLASLSPDEFANYEKTRIYSKDSRRGSTCDKMYTESSENITFLRML